MINFSEVVMLLRCISLNNHFFNPQVNDLLHSLLFKSSISTKKLVRLGFTWKLLKKNLQVLKDNKFCMKKRYTVEHFSHSPIFLPLWFFRRKKCIVLVVSLALTTGVTFPVSLWRNGGWKLFFSLWLFFFLVGCQSNNVSAGASSWFCSVTLFNRTMNCKGLVQVDSWGHRFSQCRCALLLGECGNSSLWVLLRGALLTEKKQRRGNQSIYSVSSGLD